MARIMASNTDSGIESDPEAEHSVLLVVDIGDSVITSRDGDDADCRPLVVSSDEILSSAEVNDSHDSDLSSQTTPTTSDDTPDDPMTTTPTTAPTTDSFRLSLSSGDCLTVSLDNFSDYETKCLPEFFDNSVKGKSPQKYLEIRNHFIRHWKQTKPKRFGYHEMLRKVGHLHLGNVTAFSRVQKFLESHKAINSHPTLSKQEIRRLNRRLCRQRVKRTTQQRQTADTAKRATTTATTADSPKVSSRTRPNPFKLIPLETYDYSGQEAPFAVRLSMEALAIIDIHAHCVRTEVIGLLGGRYCPRTRELKILCSEPCASLDDHDLQCDMEPVSQAVAKEALERRQQEVVGWYHSHPTFVPNPSLRDLETQHSFQRLFNRDSNGQPFVALILSPYCWTAPPQESGQTGSGGQQLVSRFKCLFLSEEWNEKLEYKIPMELKTKIIRTDKLFVSLEQKLKELFEKIANHSSRVKMADKVKRFRDKNCQEVTHSEKLFFSLRHFLRETGLSQWETEHLLRMCRASVERHLL